MSFVNRLTEFVASIQFSKRAMWMLAALFLISVGFALYIPRLHYKYDFERQFPINDPSTDFYLEFREQFGSDKNFIFIGLEGRDELDSCSFWKAVYGLSKTLENTEGLQRVLSPATFSFPIRNNFSGLFYEVPYLKNADSSCPFLDTQRIAQDQRFREMFLGEKAFDVALMAFYDPEIPLESSSDILSEVHHILSQQSFLKAHHLGGSAVSQNYFINLTKTESRKFIGASFFLIVVFLYFAFRDWRGILLPLILVGTALLWLMGTVGMLNIPLDIVLKILPTIIMIIGLSDVVHLFTKISEELQRGHSPQRAMRDAVKEVGLATFYTSLTTGIGFMSLSNSGVVPFILLGVFGALGVFYAFILTYTLLPAMLNYTGIQFLNRPVLSRKGNINRMLPKLFRWIVEHPKSIMLCTLIVIVISLYGTTKVKSDNYMLEDLSPDLEIVKDHQFFEDNFSGIRPVEFALSTKGNKLITDREVLQEMDELQQFLEAEQVGSIVSPLELTKNLNRAYSKGRPSAYDIPKSNSRLKQLQRRIKQNVHKDGLKQFIASDLKTGRLQGKTKDYGSYVARQFYERLEEKNSGFKHLEVQPTGTVYVMERNNLLLSENVYQGLLLAVLLIAILIGLLFRSFRMVGIAVFINVLPLIMIAALMGFEGISLKISTAIIFAISFGIAVDDTIHFLSKFNIEVKNGRSLLSALYRTFVSTGKAIMVTSFIVSGGFLTLTLSDFGGTYYIGLLICLTMLFALLANLFVLPVMIYYSFYKSELKA